MTDTTIPLHPGALYTYSPEGFDCTILTEVIARAEDGTVLCENHLSSDKTQATQPLAATLDPASFGLTGEYVYAGDIRDHQNNPDVGDVFLFETEEDGYGGTRTLSDGPVGEVLERTWCAGPFDQVRLHLTSRETGHAWTLNVKVADLVRHGRWVSHTRPVFDTPERYAS